MERPGSSTGIAQWVVTATVFLTTASALPFLVVPGWIPSLDVSGRSPQAWLTIVIPIILFVGIIATFFTAQQFARLPSFGQPLIFGSIILTILLVWLALQWVNLLVLSDLGTGAFQSVLIATVTVLGIVFFARARIHASTFHRAFALAGVTGGLLVIADSFIDSIALTSPNTMQYLLVPLVSVLALSSQRPWLLIGAAVILQAIIIPSPRMAIATAVLLILLGAILVPRLKVWVRVALVTGTGLIIYANFSLNSLVSRRFAERGDGALVLPDLGQPADSGSAALAVNTNGRINVWTALSEQASGSYLLFGRGAGFSRNFVSEYAGWQQPHNEYLRILVDFGLPGLLLLLAAGVALTILAIVRWRIQPSIAFGLLGVVTAVGAMSLTDLALVSFAVVLPFAIVVGSSVQVLSQSKAVTPDTTAVTTVLK